MAEPDIRFRRYLMAFFADTLAAMSGPLSVPFAGLALLVSSHWQKVLWGCLAVIGAGFASYRVWRNERKAANDQLAAKETQIASLAEELNAKITELTQELSTFKAKVDVSLQAEGAPPSQFISVKAGVSITVSRIEYMTTNDTCIVSENISLPGTSIKVPLSNTLLTQLWNTPRPDRNHADHSGPAKIGITISVNGKSHHLVLPVQMGDEMVRTAQGNVMYRKITGSKTFIGL
jgi:hypothetical protein